MRIQPGILPTRPVLLPVKTIANVISFKPLQSDDELSSLIKNSVRAIPEPSDLRESIEENIRREATTERVPRWTAPLSIAAAVLVCAGTVISYQAGHLRFTRKAQDSYIASISRPIASIMRVGLGDHVHCAVFGKRRGPLSSVDQIARDMGAGYKDLARLVAAQLPAQYRMISAHRCRYNGRQFVHIAMESGSALVSVVITGRANGESFDQSELPFIL